MEKTVGARLTSINGHLVGDILSMGEAFVPADNASHRRLVRTSLLTIPEVLQALGVVEGDRPATMTFLSDAGTEFEVRVEGLPITSMQLIRFGQKLQRETDDAWSPADLRPRSRSYWFEFQKRRKTLYFQFNAVRNDEHESLAEFSRRLQRAIEANDVERFIVDLRANGGGNNTLLEPLIDVIAGSEKVNRRGVLFVLIGRRTFSAAGNFAAALERRSKAVFLGEESGFSPNMWGDTAPYKLPRSRVIIEVATRYWEDGSPGSAVATIQPHMHVPFTHEHHFTNHDPVIEAVRAFATPEREAAREEAASALLDRKAYLWANTYLVTFSLSGGRLTMIARGDRPYVATDLNHVGDGIFETDIRDVYVRLIGMDVRLDWRGESSWLEPVPMDYRLPIDLLREGSIVAAVEAFRVAVARGARFDSDIEIDLNKIGYERLRADSISSAVRVFGLSADLFPTSADVHDSLGDGLKAAGNRDAAVKSYRRAVSINPLFESSLQSLRELGEGI